MRFNAKLILSRLLKEELGQTLPFTAVILVSLMGLSGMAVDAGHGYYAYERLKVATNAATLAGAAGMPNTSTAQTNVTTYSSAVATDKNFLGTIMSNVVTTTTFSCSSTVSSKLGVGCQALTSSGTPYNALTVKQTAQVKTWFGSLFGISQFNIAASSMASMAGGSNEPWNIAIILDTTRSMQDQDSGAQCSGEQIQCAIQGVQELLKDLQACPTGLTCSSTTKYVDDVALYVFPPVLATTAKYDYCSGSSNAPTHEWYEVGDLTVPSPAWTYQIINYSHDYQTTGASGNKNNTLNTGSDIVKALGYSGSGCGGIQAPGGAGTYYAQVIAQAQADLVVQASNNPGSQNAMIILSDGNATATATGSGSGGSFPTTTCTGGSKGYCMTNYSSSSDLLPSSNGSLNGVTGNNPTSYTYPSAVGECGQAAYEASLANNAGTTVYTIGYGALTSSSSGNCASDRTASYSVTNSDGSASFGQDGTPCQALAAMASTQDTFFSDDADGCQAASVNINYTTFTTIMDKISSSFTAARLIPVGTT
jgi:Flp pilus assembly protein TadG